MKVLALDLGDMWTGVAISDALRITARPYKTVATTQLEKFLAALKQEEKVSTIIVGYPKTMRGTESQQTKKIVATKEQLEKQFPDYTWILWDERLSSKRAAALATTRTKEEKQKSHARAAASILETYLHYLALHDNHES